MRRPAEGVSCCSYFGYDNNQMNVIWHHDILVDANIIILYIELAYIFVHDFPDFGQFYLRDVVNAIPYDFTEKFLLTFGAYRHEIVSVLAVIVFSEPCGLTLR